MTTAALRALGWNAFFEDQLSAFDRDSIVLARVSAHHSIQVELQGEHGQFRLPVQSADADGRVSVGDWLVLNPAGDRTIKRLERQTLLARKAAGEEAKPQIIAANINTVFIVSSCNEDFNLSRLERYLAMVLQAGATPVVVLTKADSSEDPGPLAERARQLHPGLDVVLMVAEAMEGDRLIIMVSDGQSPDLRGGEYERVAAELREENITLYHIHVASADSIPTEVVDMDLRPVAGMSVAIDRPIFWLPWAFGVAAAFGVLAILWFWRLRERQIAGATDASEVPTRVTPLSAAMAIIAANITRRLILPPPRRPAPLAARPRTPPAPPQ